MATLLPIGGKVVLAAQTATAVAETFEADDIIFGKAMYRQTGNDVEATLQNGDIERDRQSLSYEVTFEVWGDFSDEGVVGATTDPLMERTNVGCVCYEDDGTTPVGTEFYGTCRRSYSESSETTSFTVTGNTTAVPDAA